MLCSAICEKGIAKIQKISEWQKKNKQKDRENHIYNKVYAHN